MKCDTTEDVKHNRPPVRKGVHTNVREAYIFIRITLFRFWCLSRNRVVDFTLESHAYDLT
jgi:hypothetical protein